MAKGIDINIPKVTIPKVTVPRIKISDLEKWEAPDRIPPGTRKKVWIKRFGNANSGLCYCCKEREIYDNAWICGHRRAKSRGGTMKISNLEPICQRCSLGMGKQDLIVYQRNHFPNAVE
jgi:5-methylcytosine-specific restriction endonuclease McrA